MIAYLKEAEINPLILTKTIQYKSSSTNPQEKTSLTKGNFYSIDRLINTMVIDSDNEAMNLLVDNAEPSSIIGVFKDLNLTTPSNTNKENLDVVSARDFGLVFRALYGASYLNHEISNHALDLLTKTRFTTGIAAGVPSSITIAHKFGARTVVPTEGKLINTPAKELHNCGIIYYPNHPYLLCVMTRGNDFDLLAKAIGNISKLVYTEMDIFYKKESK